jgi:acyl-CoA synthetase (AMP-forming)/AMP-acid ligase II
MPSSLNVASHLARMAVEHPSQVALHAPRRRVNPHGHTPHRAITFSELHADSDAIAHGLAAANITRGTRTALMVPPAPDFFALTFALFKVGAVPVLIDPGMGVKNLGKCLAEAEPEAFIGVAKAHAARRVLGWTKKTIRTTVNAGRWRFFCDTSLARLRRAGSRRGPWTIPDPGADETAAILFTSGSTGVAKGVVYTHGIFAAQVEILRQTYGIAPGEIDLCTFPLFALFGPALGMTCVIPDMDAARPAQIDPRKAAAQIRQFGATNMFGSPAVIRRLGDWACELRRDAPGRDEWRDAVLLPTLKRAISAGAPASAASLERFVRLLPDGAEVYTPYGATEALPVANIGSREILSETRALTEQGKGVCVGRPVAGVEVRVIRISDEPIAEWDDSLLVSPGEVGEFVVRGPTVTREYYNRPDATRSAKIRDPKTGEVLHRMGDVGYIDDRGRLWFCGRKSHRVVTPHGTLFTDMVEPIFNALGERTALVGVKRNGVTHPVVCVEVRPVSPDSWPVQQQSHHRWQRGMPDEGCDFQTVAARFEHTRLIRTFILHRGPFPVDVRHNSKIFREKLAVWADKHLGRKWNPEVYLEE